MNAAALVKSKLTYRSLWLLLSLGLLIGLAKPAAAQSGDPPARVARVAEVIGDAWMFDAENKEWTRVTRNQTVGEGDRLRTDERSRISLRIGSTSVWLDERTDLAFDQLDEGQVLMLLDKGDLGLRLRSQDAASDFRVRTREGMVFTERDGLYRVEQLDRGSKAYVFNGRLRFESGRGGRDVQPVWLQNNEQAEFWWANGARVERQRLENDGFGDWLVAQNNRDGDMSISQRYVSPEMTGAEDLDRNGRWQTADDFGSVWIPTSVNAGWVPYRDGRWVWTSHWGWSWVDDAPWGFAPFHYGRWVQWGGRWCWSPGRYVARPVYAPALVAWVGGPGLSIGINVGGGGRNPPPRQGWVPLAPREAYVPAYRHSPTYGVRVNNGDHDQVPANRPHRNQNVVGAVSYLPGQGGQARALPPADGVGPTRPVLTPTAPPARGEFAGMQPQPRPVADVRNAPQAGGGNNNNGMPWRSEGERRRGGQREPQDQQPPQQQQQQPQQQPPRAVPAEPAMQQRVPDRAVDNNRNNNWNNNNERVGPSRPSGFERPQEQPQQQQRPVEQQQQQRPVEQQQPQRQFEQRPVEQPQPQRPQQVERPRPVEMPVQQVRPPQPQVGPPQPPAQRAEDKGPQRGRQDGPRPARDRERNENER